MAGENESSTRAYLREAEMVTDDYCMRCPEDTLNNPDICDGCRVRKMVDYYRGAVEREMSHNPAAGKTREDVEKLKREWTSDPCWDIYDTEGFEVYRDELTAFQKEQEAAWERKRQEERAKLEALICPLVTLTDCKCNTDKCAWWCDWKDACAIKVTAEMLGGIADTLPAAGRGY